MTLDDDEQLVASKTDTGDGAAYDCCVCEHQSHMQSASTRLDPTKVELTEACLKLDEITKCFNFTTHSSLISHFSQNSESCLDSTRWFIFTASSVF